MKQQNQTYHDTFIHNMITTMSVSALVVMTFGCYITSTYLVWNWFDTISMITIPLVVLLIVVVGSMMMSVCIMIVLLISFVIDEHFERRWEKTHEKINK